MMEKRARVLSLGDSIKMDATILDELCGEHFHGEPMDKESILQLCENIQRDVKTLKAIASKEKV